ncbi:MAG: LamG-like jellyroll fold domain-containing protein [Corynebacterium sp.]|nr:LamG-like jellyroll fold domain-containing protein [Corynebacterium sp.]
MRVSVLGITSFLTASALALTGVPAIAQAQSLPVADIANVDLTQGSLNNLVDGLAPTEFGKPVTSSDSLLRNSVVRFDGDDAVMYDISLGDEQLSDKDGFTVECTFKYEGDVATANASICGNLQQGGFSLNLKNDRLNFNVVRNGRTFAPYGKIVSGEWYHVVGTVTENWVRLYINGVRVDHQWGEGQFENAPEGLRNFTLGANSAADGQAERFGDFTLLHARVYSVGMTADQVEKAYEEAGASTSLDTSVSTSTPAEGTHLTEPTVFGATFNNADLFVTTPKFFLDGKEIKLGTVIGPGLAQGKHEIEMETTALLGRPVRETIQFTTGNFPEFGSVDQAEMDGGTILSVVGQTPGGGGLHTTFVEGTTAKKIRAFEGTVRGFPQTLDFAYGNGRDINDALLPGDGNTTTTEPSVESPFQRIDLAVEESANDGHDVVWKGHIDPRRSAQLYVWNLETGQWERRADSRGIADGDITLSTHVGREFVENGVIHAMVIGYDIFADDLNKPVVGAFESPDEYDFSIVHYSDTQYLSQGAVNPSLSPEARAMWNAAYSKATQWIVDNAESRKIAYVGHTGDLIQNWHNKRETYDTAVREFEVASVAQQILDDAGIVNGVLPGNHDNYSGLDNADDGAPEDVLYNKYFGASRYEELAKTSAWANQGASYHPWKPGDNSNHYDLFSASGLDFIAVHLGYLVTEEEAAWADSVLKQYPDRNAIVLAHSYSRPSVEADGRGSKPSADGPIILEEVVKPNDNVFLVLSGHEPGVALEARRDVSYDGNHVVELLADYQGHRVPAEKIKLDGQPYHEVQPDVKSWARINFGASFLRLLQFDLESSEVVVNTYSPLLDEFGATDYFTEVKYSPEADEFRIPVQLQSRTTTLETDGFTAFTQTSREIGNSTVASGKPALVGWKNLTPGQFYNWYAISKEAGVENASLSRYFGYFVAGPNSAEASTDTEAPVLTVPGEARISVKSEFDALAGVQAEDNVDGDISSNVEAVSTVDVNQPGRYVVTYIARDAAGNQALAHRVVVVEAVSPSESPTDKTPVSSDSASSQGRQSGLSSFFGNAGGFLGAILGSLLTNVGAFLVLSSMFPEQVTNFIREIGLKIRR